MISRPCTTPHKKAYTTHNEAEHQRTTDGLRYGTALYTYRCICGNWHLTRHNTEPPAYAHPAPEDVARLQHLDNTAFTDLVDADTKKTATLADRLALRHPNNLTRWRWALRNLRTTVTKQLATNPTAPNAQAWRTKAELYRDALNLALAECQHIRRQTTALKETA